MDLEERMGNLEQRLGEIEDLMRGKGSSVDGGLIHLLQRIVETLYGPKENPGGMVAAVERLTRVLWVGMGVGLSLNIAWMVFSHFHR